MPIPLHLVEALDKLVAGRPRSALVSESERGKVLRVRTFRRKVDRTKLVADLSFDGFRIHDLRATAVTNVLAAVILRHPLAPGTSRTSVLSVVQQVPLVRYG